MRELRRGLWHWQAPHPEWTPEQHWPQHVSSCAIDDGVHLVLFDPLSVPDPILALAGRREPAVVLTAPWHERDTRALVQRFGLPVFAPRPDSAQDLVDKFGITIEQAGDGSPDLGWLMDGGADAHWYGAGDPLPLGIAAYEGREANDLVLWAQGAGAVIAGDTLQDFGAGLGVSASLRGGVRHEDVVQRLQPLLSLPVEVVLPAHGVPTDLGALRRALS